MELWLILVVLVQFLVGVNCQRILPLSENDKEEIVQGHNLLRASVSPQATNMREMAYSEELAMVAQDYALMCSAAHSDRNERAQAAPSFSSVGENIFATFHSSLTINYTSYIVDSWGLDEKRYYSYELNSCDPGRVCGHYTQIIWAGSVHVGCGAVFCPSERIFGQPGFEALLFICNYGPAGNFIGERPYLPGTACSACPADYTKCSNNLCTSMAAPQTDPLSTQPPPVQTDPPTTTAQAPFTQTDPPITTTQAPFTQTDSPSSQSPVQTDPLVTQSPPGQTDPPNTQLPAQTNLLTTQPPPTQTDPLITQLPTTHSDDSTLIYPPTTHAPFQTEPQNTQPPLVQTDPPRPQTDSTPAMTSTHNRVTSSDSPSTLSSTLSITPPAATTQDLLTPKPLVTLTGDSPRMEGSSVVIALEFVPTLQSVLCFFDRMEPVDCSSGTARFSVDTSLYRSHILRVKAVTSGGRVIMLRRNIKTGPTSGLCLVNFINSGMKLLGNGQALLEFSSSGPVKSYLCSFNYQELTPCESGQMYSDLRTGFNRVKVVPDGCGKNRRNAVMTFYNY